jgi:hypothetical protein
LALLHRSGKVLLARASFLTSSIAPGATLVATNTTSAGIPSGPGVFLPANFPAAASSSSSVNASCGAFVRRRHLGMGFSGNSFFTVPSTSSFEGGTVLTNFFTAILYPLPQGFSSISWTNNLQAASFALCICSLSSFRAFLYSCRASCWFGSCLLVLVHLLLARRQSFLLVATSGVHQYTGLRVPPGSPLLFRTASHARPIASVIPSGVGCCRASSFLLFFALQPVSRQRHMSRQLWNCRPLRRRLAGFLR